jgi:hypothetical protein
MTPRINLLRRAALAAVLTASFLAVPTSGWATTADAKRGAACLLEGSGPEPIRHRDSASV